jgi:isoamylase
VMTNAYWEEVPFRIQEGTPQDWVRIVDTSLPTPDDFAELGVPLKHATYRVAPRSIVVLVRARANG